MPEISLDDLTIVRTRLLDAVRPLQPRILALCAPAGYGKSLFARQFAATSASVFWVDGFTARGAAAFAAALAEALALESGDEPRRSGSARNEPQPVSGSEVLTAWRSGGRPEAVFVFENVEALDEPATELLRSCLADPGVRRTVIVCTRTYVNTRFSRDIRPTDVVTVGARQLRFDVDEIAQLFGGLLTPADVQRVELLTEGWPLALAVCRRAHQLGSLEHMLSDPDDIELSRIEGYIAGEVVADLSEAELNALCVLSLSEDLTPADLAVALNIERHEIVRFIRRLPLVQHEHQRFYVHPLLVRYLGRHHRQRRRAAGAAASESFAAGGFDVLAARIAFAAGDPDRAAGMLNPGVLFLSRAPAEVVDFTEALDSETLTRHPRLWNTAMLYRSAFLTNAEWRDEVLGMWQRLPIDADSDMLLGVANNVCAMLIVLGDWDRLETFRVEASRQFARSGLADEPKLRALGALWDGWVASSRLRSLDLERFLTEVSELTRLDYVSALVQREIVARVRRLNGDRDAERDALRKAVESGRQSNVPTTLSLCLRQSAISAWWAGEDDEFENVVSLLAKINETLLGTPEGRTFVAHVRGENHVRDAVDTHPSMYAMTLLIHASRSPDAHQRKALIQQAISVSDNCRHVEPMIVTRLVAAAADAREAHRLDEVRSMIEELRGNTIFHRHLAQPESKTSPLANVLDRFRAPRLLAAPVVVSLLTGTAKVGDAQVTLSAREFAVLAYLALQPRQVTVDAAAEAIWPRAAGTEAIGSIRVYINRVRRRLGDPTAIASLRRAYAIGTHVTTDIATFEHRVSALRSSRPDESIPILLSMRTQLVHGLPSWVADFPAFIPVQARINQLIDDIENTLSHLRDGVSKEVASRIDSLLRDDVAEHFTA